MELIFILLIFTLDFFQKDNESVKLMLQFMAVMHLKLKKMNDCLFKR